MAGLKREVLIVLTDYLVRIILGKKVKLFALEEKKVVCMAANIKKARKVCTCVYR